jgi:hypothetical protein
MLCPTQTPSDATKKGIKKAAQLTIRLFFLFPLSPAELGGEVLFSETLPGVSTRTCGVDALTGSAEGVPVGAAAAIFGAALAAEPVVSPPVRDRMNEPGSPTRGFSSMNSSP